MLTHSACDIAAAAEARANPLHNRMEVNLLKSAGAGLGIKLQLTHRFPKDGYEREVFLPKDSIHATKIHLVEHPFRIVKGAVVVMDGEGRFQTLRAPYEGITRPGTRRMIYVLEDCIWITYHPNLSNTRDLAQLERELIYPHNELP